MNSAPQGATTTTTVESPNAVDSNLYIMGQAERDAAIVPLPSYEYASDSKVETSAQDHHGVAQIESEKPHDQSQTTQEAYSGTNEKGNPTFAADTPKVDPTAHAPLQPPSGSAAKWTQPGLENTQAVPFTKLAEAAACIDCPRCEFHAMTRTEQHSGSHTHSMAAILCLCCGLIFAWLPYVIPSCKDTEHFCTNCNVQLAIVHKNGGVEVIDQDRLKRQAEQNRLAREQHNAQNPAAKKK